METLRSAFSLRSCVQQLGHELVERGAGRGLQHELILGAADHRIDGQVLHRLKIEGDARHAMGVLQPAGPSPSATPSRLVLGLEIDQEAAAVEGVVGAVHADEGGQAGDVRILQDLGGQLLLALGHGVEARRWGRPR